MQSYIHIPFCSSKCKYCRFASTISDDKKIEIYFKYLEREIKNYNKKTEELSTVYFGWGTPSSVDFKYINNILILLKNKFWFEKNIEITLETTPQNINKNNLASWKKAWITRISTWIQSLNNNTLKEIWREDKSVILSSLDLLENSDFNNISIDFILWLPYEKPWEKLEQIKYIIKKYKKIKHISLYMLEDYDYPKHWDKIKLAEEEFNSEYNNINNYLEKNNFNKYELSNFAIKNYECQHNIWYWEHKNYVWFWLDAHSFLDNIRSANSSNFKDYYKSILAYNEELSQNDLILEKLMFSIRREWIGTKYFKYLDENKVNNFILEWYLEWVNNKLKITNKAFSLVDHILQEIIK